MLTLSTDIVAWREEYRPEMQYQLTQEASLCVLEYLDPLQRVQVYVDGYLCLQLVCRQHTYSTVRTTWEKYYVYIHAHLTLQHYKEKIPQYMTRIL